jgi:hypothetical protein
MDRFDQDNFTRLLDSAESNDHCNKHKDFWEWAKETPELVAKLELIGQIKIEPVGDHYDLQYWGENAPIQLDKYPYYGCKVLRCKVCGALFFHYEEIGGHGGQKRYRLVRKELIIHQ